MAVRARFIGCECLLTGDGSTARQGGEKVGGNDGQASAALLAPTADAGHHDGSDGTKESCLKVCDDGTHTLPKAYAGVDHNHPGPAPLVATLWTEAPNLVSAPRRPDDLAIPIVGPPLRVRYSRLAL